LHSSGRLFAACEKRISALYCGNISRNVGWIVGDEQKTWQRFAERDGAPDSYNRARHAMNGFFRWLELAFNPDLRASLGECERKVKDGQFSGVMTDIKRGSASDKEAWKRIIVEQRLAGPVVGLLNDLLSKQPPPWTQEVPPEPKLPFKPLKPDSVASLEQEVELLWKRYGDLTSSYRHLCDVQAGYVLDGRRLEPVSEYEVDGAMERHRQAKERLETESAEYREKMRQYSETLAEHNRECVKRKTSQVVKDHDAYLAARKEWQKSLAGVELLIDALGEMGDASAEAVLAGFTGCGVRAVEVAATRALQSVAAARPDR
jgi:hypothetical protein